MTKAFTVVPDVSKAVVPPLDGTLSRTVYQDGRVKVVLFGFGAGQELSEHTASMPAILHFLEGEADVTLGSEPVSAKEGTWIHMAADLPHSIKARAPVRMLLVLMKPDPQDV